MTDTQTIYTVITADPTKIEVFADPNEADIYIDKVGDMEKHMRRSEVVANAKIAYIVLTPDAARIEIFDETLYFNAIRYLGLLGDHYRNYNSIISRKIRYKKK